MDEVFRSFIKQVRDRMGTLNPETVDALNMLLEDVRASIEIEVALSNGATEHLEREALTQMGVEDTLIAFLLRDWLDSLNVPVTRRINGIVLQALDLTRYDDRLLLFVHHQLASSDQAERLLNENTFDREGEAILRSIVDAHTRHAAWCERRAREFAETRQFEFRQPGGHTHGPEVGGSEDDPLPGISGEHSSPRMTSRMMAESDMDADMDADMDRDMDRDMDTGMEGAASERESPPVE